MTEDELNDSQRRGEYVPPMRMIDKDKIKRGPPKHNPTCYQLQQDIVIPAGTILRREEPDMFGARVGPVGSFSIFIEPGDPTPEGFKKVIA